MKVMWALGRTQRIQNATAAMNRNKSSIFDFRRFLVFAKVADWPLAKCYIKVKFKLFLNDTDGDTQARGGTEGLKISFYWHC